jgi:hypothetical protein
MTLRNSRASTARKETLTLVLKPLSHRGHRHPRQSIRPPSDQSPVESSLLAVLPNGEPIRPIPIRPSSPFLHASVPLPAAAWYYFQQYMMGVPVYGQPGPPSVTPPVAPQSPIAQSTNTGPGTSIMNIVTFNEIGTDNSTNVQTHKNGRSCCCSTTRY